MDTKKIMLDIGAHEGQSSIHMARENSNLYIYAFEPVPELAKKIKSKITDLTNYTVVMKAVSYYNGESFFNVRGEGDWGQGSLSDFTDRVGEVWAGANLKFTDKIKVEVIRLDTFIEKNNIDVIDYLHVDAQGQDLNVLKGLGKYISIVKSGVVEASNPDRLCYTEQNTINDTVDFLKESGFEITNIAPNDNMKNEFNIYFKGI